MAARVIACVMAKGGTGKTTTVANLGVMLAQHKRRVLLVDLDLQANLILQFGASRPTPRFSIYHILFGEAQVEDAAVKVGPENAPVDLLAASEDLMALDHVILRDDDWFPRRFRVLADALAPVLNRYDYVLLDTPPGLTLATANALGAVDAGGGVILPLQLEPAALSGLAMMLDHIDDIRKRHNHDLRVLGVLPVMFQAAAALSSHVLQELRKRAADRYWVFNAVIPRSVAAANGPAYFGLPTALSIPGHAVAKAYHEFTEEVMALVEKASPRPGTVSRDTRTPAVD